MLPLSTVPFSWKFLHIRIVPLSISFWGSPWSIGLSRRPLFLPSILATLLPTSDLSLRMLLCTSIYVLSFRLPYCRSRISSSWIPFFLFCQCFHTSPLLSLLLPIYPFFYFFIDLVKCWSVRLDPVQLYVMHASLFLPHPLRTCQLAQFPHPLPILDL